MFIIVVNVLSYLCGHKEVTFEKFEHFCTLLEFQDFWQPTLLCEVQSILATNCCVHTYQYMHFQHKAISKEHLAMFQKEQDYLYEFLIQKYKVNFNLKSVYLLFSLCSLYPPPPQCFTPFPSPVCFTLPFCPLCVLDDPFAPCVFYILPYTQMITPLYFPYVLFMIMIMSDLCCLLRCPFVLVFFGDICATPCHHLCVLYPLFTCGL